MGINRTKLTLWARWLATFVGFPLGGVAARLVVGDVDSAGSALVGGLVAGAVLGAAQAVIGGFERVQWSRWIAATSFGFGAGLTVGATIVDFDTDTASLVTMGAVTGAMVGLAQAIAAPIGAVDRVMWMLATPVLWALGWFITSQVIVDAESQHAVFGSSGAVTVSALSGVLIVWIRRSAIPTSNEHGSLPSAVTP
jgi:hypothetical protein